MIYFVKTVGHPYVKIGYTEHFERRMNQLQVACPFELKVLGVFAGNQEAELSLHKRFGPPVRGEWFIYSPEIASYLDLRWEAEPELSKAAVEGKPLKTRPPSVPKFKTKKELKEFIRTGLISRPEKTYRKSEKWHKARSVRKGNHDRQHL